ncbi:MAG TPA: trypsin-like peptidase domain-containing protein [Vicinamibacterales bacterium]|nr:trypsin-like peptidase domain-containing protein [Vicinamibacterales bacterium]
MQKIVGTLVCLAGMFCLVHARPGAQPPSGWQFGPQARIIWTETSATELARALERRTWTPAVNPERPRGGVDLYARVAPAVVVVRTDRGHGTGFIVSPTGHVLTNHHVVSGMMTHDAARGASYANVHLGTLGADGMIALRKEPIRAWLLKLEAATDLALLKLDLPAGSAPLPALKLAAAGPRPGMAASAIGHPADGMLWTLRSGEVASMGRMPADMVDLVMLQLSAAAPQREQMAEALSRAVSRKIILTSIGVNHGDSGGPIVDANGDLIAVTFAMPASHGKFSYHVHLDEVRQFRANTPAAPILDLPEAWQLGPNVDVQDLDGDRKPDVLVAGSRAPEQFLFDLDNDTPAAALSDPGALVRSRKWDFEFALRIAQDEPMTTAFYDTDGDGAIDVIFTADKEDQANNWKFTRAANGQWQIERNVKLAFFSPSLIRDQRLAQRLASMLKRGPGPQ